METIVISKVTPGEFKFSVIESPRENRSAFTPKSRYEFRVGAKRIGILPQAILSMELEINQHGDGKLTIFTSPCKYEIHATSSYSAGIVECYEHWLTL